MSYRNTLVHAGTPVATGASPQTDLLKSRSATFWTSMQCPSRYAWPANPSKGHCEDLRGIAVRIGWNHSSYTRRENLRPLGFSRRWFEFLDEWVHEPGATYMHARELLELAGLVAIHGPVLVTGQPKLREPGLERYWAASKCRLQRWNHSLQNYLTLLSLEEDTDRLWELLAPTLEEIMTGEILARVWTAIAGAHDSRHGVRQFEPVARNILIGQLEVRNRTLNVLLLAEQQNASCGERLNRLRRSSERWSDLLLAFLSPTTDVSHLAFDQARTLDFASELSHASSAPAASVQHLAVFASFRAAFLTAMNSTSPNADLNQRIASSILSTFQPGLFDSFGTIKSLWMERVHHTASDTEGMIEELLELDSEPASHPSPLVSEPGHRFLSFLIRSVWCQLASSAQEFLVNARTHLDLKSGITVNSRPYLWDIVCLGIRTPMHGCFG